MEQRQQWTLESFEFRTLEWELRSHFQIGQKLNISKKDADKNPNQNDNSSQKEINGNQLSKSSGQLSQDRNQIIFAIILEEQSVSSKEFNSEIQELLHQNSIPKILIEQFDVMD
ncbi:unnamed protein product [Paramecium octaurelia]|uniref:Uncharacterized protein n=1 Tax=Paramecium octaurelia TaxID=43137 RepID=A0A8S1SYF9_PAROT|nr:unnamed protein product [Paramecium octaurelia]